MITSCSTVAVVACRSYDQALVTNALSTGISLLGGASAFAQPDEQILFKPNVLWGTNPAQCIVTHPSVLRAAIELFLPVGAHLLYGDSPAGLQQTATAMKRCGYDRVLDGLPVTITDFNEGVSVDLPSGLAGKRLQIAKPVIDAHGVINLPKLKTHGLTRMTGAIKNLYGCVPSLVKGEYHARFPDVDDFCRLLADIASFVKPRLHIMDAIEAMEGNGPRSGTPKRLGVILLSSDPVALDVVACKLIDLDPAFVPVIDASVTVGLGCADFGRIRLVGDDLAGFVDRSFRVVRKRPVTVPQNTLLGTVKRFFLPRPVIQKTTCTRCGRCISICPLKPPALMRTSEKKVPRYNYATCIRCYCCHEVCPQGAITIKNTLFSKRMPFVTYLSLLFTNSRARKDSVQK